MYLGLDIGTSVIKAALFNCRGRQTGEASERISGGAKFGHGSGGIVPLRAA